MDLFYRVHCSAIFATWIQLYHWSYADLVYEGDEHNIYGCELRKATMLEF